MVISITTSAHTVPYRHLNSNNGKVAVGDNQPAIFVEPELQKPIEERPLEELPKLSKVEQPQVAPVVSAPKGDPKTIAKQTLAELGLSDAWPAVDFIFMHESTWRPDAVNAGGCIGLGQSCPTGSGLKTECPNWQTDVACQVRHFTKYANKYGGWNGALSFWHIKSWW